MQVFLTYFGIGPNDTAVKNRPKAFNRLSVDCPDDVLTGPAFNNLMRIFLRQLAISGPLVSAKQTDFERDVFVDECSEGVALNVLNDAGDDVAFATDRADDNGFAFLRAFALPRSLLPMLIAAVAAHNSFVNLDHTAKLLHVLVKSSSDFVAHEPSSP